MTTLIHINNDNSKNSDTNKGDRNILPNITRAIEIMNMW